MADLAGACVVVDDGVAAEVHAGDDLPALTLAALVGPADLVAHGPGVPVVVGDVAVVVRVAPADQAACQDDDWAAAGPFQLVPFVEACLGDGVVKDDVAKVAAGGQASSCWAAAARYALAFGRPLSGPEVAVADAAT